MLQMKTVWLAFVFHLRAFLFVCCALGRGFVFIIFFSCKAMEYFLLRVFVKVNNNIAEKDYGSRLTT